MGKVAERVYERLQERLRAANAFDFDDLLLYGYLLLKNHADVREAYQDRFRYLMVDEYQDTNRAQYAITQLLAAKHRNIMVVGDDDQSIYSLARRRLAQHLGIRERLPRGQGGEAGAELPQRGQHPGRGQRRHRQQPAPQGEAPVHGLGRRGEDHRCIWPPTSATRAAGSPGRSTGAAAEGTSYNNMAVFYRTNAQSRMLEDMLLRAGVPYRIVGGTRFFDRAEIRDVMAYLTLVVNPADDIAAKRVVNVPRRGIGKTTIERIDQYGREMNMPFLDGGRAGGRRSGHRAPPPAMPWGSSSRSSRTAPPTGAICARSWR